jgi:hypothetical protein
MIKQLKAGVKRAFGLHPPRRGLLILPDDIFLVSFPKSGNTWTRFLLANLRFPDQPITFANIDKLVPDPTSASKKEFDQMPRPRIIKSHECFDPRYPRVVYIVRDPRDVVVSQYHYHRKLRKIEDDSTIETFVTRFLAGETCPHGSWGQNVSTWLAASEGSPRFLLLRYEGLVAETTRELAKVVAFLHLRSSPDQITQAVERSSADHMRKLEKAQTDKNGLTKGSRKDLSFVRAAVPGGWRAELPAPMVARLEAAWGPLMQRLGYRLSDDSTAVRDSDSLGIFSRGSQR